MSSYSPDLRIELISTGDQAGTWGNTTNTNLGTIIESAIAGYSTVSVISAAQAFTVVDGAADQARLAMIRLTTTTAANFSVYAPPVSKQYIIWNNSGYTATIYNSTTVGGTTAAGTGITIANGDQVLIWSNGTNFYTIKSNGITGVLPVLNGGTGVTTSTGSGANVLGTSPSIDSPTLTGTPVASTASFGTNTTQVATTAFVQAALQALHPVGSIYINATNATNPGTLLGFGTWTAFGAGRVPVGFNASNPLFDTAEETGGSADAVVVSHTHTATTTITDPGHFHTMTGDFGSVSDFFGGSGNDYGAGIGSAQPGYVVASNTTGITATTTIASSGVSGTNANYQPYITVYMWKRTA